MNNSSAAQPLGALLERAEASLARHLDDNPNSKHKRLLSFYSEIRAGVPHAGPYPTARDLFWDDPEDDIEAKCLDDALALFQFLQSGAR
jgi:hypothetical protein